MSLGIIDELAAAGVKSARFLGFEKVDWIAMAYKVAMEAHCETTGVEYLIEARVQEFGKDELNLPSVDDESSGHVWFHVSPPCQCFSAARVGSASKDQYDQSVALFRLSLQTVVDNNYRFWSLENVEKTAFLVDEFHSKYHWHFPKGSECIYSAQHYGSPSDRTRLVASSPEITALMRAASTVAASSVRKALAEHDLSLPSEFISNGNKSNGVFAKRRVDETSPTVTASHALSWLTDAGALVRCLNKQESAALLGFPKGFTLPKGSRDAIHAIGNAVSPYQSRMVARAVLAASRNPRSLAPQPEAPEAPGWEDAIRELRGMQEKNSKEIKRLKRKLKELQHH
jgi:site-specific DNA-cytosine methylase